MVQYLALAGANRFWEHILLEPLLNKRSESSKNSTVTDKKPQPDSPLHPIKADFIRKKYLFHGFFKLPSVIHPDDLNQQLHASVRTAVLETSLYLLALVSHSVVILRPRSFNFLWRVCCCRLFLCNSVTVRSIIFDAN